MSSTDRKLKGQMSSGTQNRPTSSSLGNEWEVMMSRYSPCETHVYVVSTYSYFQSDVTDRKDFWKGKVTIYTSDTFLILLYSVSNPLPTTYLDYLHSVFSIKIISSLYWLLLTAERHLGRKIPKNLFFTILLFNNTWKIKVQKSRNWTLGYVFTRSGCFTKRLLRDKQGACFNHVQICKIF